jgi:hypothetical protein
MVLHVQVTIKMYSAAAGSYAKLFCSIRAGIPKSNRVPHFN